MKKIIVRLARFLVRDKISSIQNVYPAELGEV